MQGHPARDLLPSFVPNRWPVSLSRLTESEKSESPRALFEAFVAYAIFCAVTFLSRYLPLAMHAMALGGIAFPLAWGKSTGRWAEMGFTRRNAAAAVHWESEPASSRL